MRAGTTPARRWGYHALRSPWPSRLVADARIEPGHLVVDLGAGTGALTRALVEAGARVLAVEAHASRALALERTFARHDVTVLRRDIVRLRLPREPFRVVANPPWALTEHVLATLLRAPSLVSAHLVLPRWSARRAVERSPRVRIGRSVPAEAFSPPAPAGAAVAVVLPPRRR